MFYVVGYPIPGLKGSEISMICPVVHWHLGYPKPVLNKFKISTIFLQ